MKILTIFEDGRIGGPHNQFLYFYKKNNKLNQHNHLLIIPNFNKHKIFDKKINFIKLNLTYLSKSNLFFYFISFFWDIYKISREIIKNKINIIYIGGGSNCIKSVISSIITRRKFIWHIHDTNSNLMLVIFFNLFKFFSEKIIFVSYKSKNFYLKNNKFKNFIILPSAIDVNFFEKNCFNKKVTNKIIMIANFNPDKDFLTAIDVIHNIENNNKKIFFYVLGKVWDTQKDYFLKVKNKILEKKIKNLKLVTKTKSINKYLKQADILLSTSINESLPLSICEAMASSKAIISTDVGDIKKFVEMKNNNINPGGKVFNRYDHEAISKFILNLYKNKNKIKKLGYNSNKIANNYFNIFSYSKKLNKILTHHL